MVFCLKHCSNLLWEKIVKVIEQKLLKIWDWSPRDSKNFGITIMIYWNSERLEQFLKVGIFFKLVNGAFYRSNTLEQLKCLLEQIIEM